MAKALIAGIIVLVLGCYVYQFYWDVAMLQVITIDGSELAYQRRVDGLIEGYAMDDFDFARLLGYLHAMDRGMQLYITKLTGEGRLSETLAGVPQLTKIDVAIRAAGFSKRVSEAAQELTPTARRVLEAYGAGINTYFRTHSRPWYFFLVDTPEPWKVEDSLFIMKIMSYLGLADVQMDIEKLIMESVQMNSTSFELMKALFGKHLENIPAEVIEVLKRVPLVHSPLAGATDFMSSLSAYKGSNNWAVSAARSVHGGAMYASDPHLEVNRLPAIWYEVICHVGARGARDFRAGISLPGVPGLVMGRSRKFASGFTYGFSDSTDYFIEEVRDGKVRRPGDRWEVVPSWSEEVKRRQNTSLIVHIFQTSHGILERPNPHAPMLEDGLYLARAYVGLRSNESHVIEFALNMPQFDDVHQAISFGASRHSEVSMNGIVADWKGNIAYLQMAAVPKRTPGWSGMWPQLGWSADAGWFGIRENRELQSIVNPSEGQLQTANDEHNPSSGNFVAVNFHMGSYRSDRIRQLLAEKPKLSTEDFQRIQSDLFSTQADAFMKILRPLLPTNNRTAEILRSWDCCYSADSRAAPLFEEFYTELLAEVYGRVLGPVNWRHLSSRLVFGLGFHYFDDLIFEYSPKYDDMLWHGESRNVLFSRVIKAVLAKHNSTASLPTYGEQRKFGMHNIFFGDRIPSFLGFEESSVAVGSRATIVQGQVFKHSWKGKNIPSVAGVSYRFIADLAGNLMLSALPGGASENRFSPFYKNEVSDWANFVYKTLEPFHDPVTKSDKQKTEL